MNPIKVAIVAEFDPSFSPHIKTNEALEHSAAALGISIDKEWVSTANISLAHLRKFDGFLIAPGSPYKNMDGALLAIQFAREESRPLLGTCGGFQHIIIEYARNVLGFKGAEHEENNPNSSELFISRLACSLAGRTLTINLSRDSVAAGFYKATSAREEYYCRFGVNPKHVKTLASGPLRIVGSDAEGEVRVVELPGHPFFIGTLFVPQISSSGASPHPLVSGFIMSAKRWPKQGIHQTLSTNKPRGQRG